MPLETYAELHERLRAAGPVTYAVVATVDPSPQDAAAQWARETGWKRGVHATPPASVLATLCAAWCESRGWAVAPTARQLGQGLTRAGWRRLQRDGWRGYAVDADTAERLWQAARLHGCTARRETRKPRRYQPKPTRRPIMAESHGRPVLDSTLRVYPSAAVAAVLVRCAAPSISHACHRGCPAAGFLWRFLTPEEVGSLPPTTRAGDRVPSLRW